MTGPEVRAEMAAIAAKLARSRPAMSQRLLELVEELKRRPPSRKAAPTSRPMTPTLAKQIRAYAMLHPTYSMHRIAQHHRVNMARVSEALNGKRT